MFRRLLNDTGGNISIAFAGTLPVLLLGLVATLDISGRMSTKSKMQNALDGAVINVVLNSQEEDYKSYGENSFSSNFDSAGLENTTVEFYRDNNKIIGIASATRPALFGNILPESNRKITATSTATTTEPAETGVKPCVMALSKNASPGITLNSGATIDAPGCEMHVHSENGNNAMSVNSGIDITLDRTCVAGKRITDNSQGAIGNLELECEVEPDPYAGTIVEPTSLACDENNGNFNGSEITMEPGVYCGWFNFNNSNAKVNFLPGTYILRNGGWNVNGGTWTGEGVTFYYHDNSRIQFNSGVEANMTASTEGDYAGFFMTERPGLSGGNFILNDNEGFNFEGIMYLPSRNITFNGQSTLGARNLQLIGDRITFNNARLSINSDFVSASGSDGSATGGSVSVYLAE